MAPRQRLSPTPPDEDTTSSPPMLDRNPLIMRADSEDSMSSSTSSLFVMTESDIARDQHDIFNLFALLPVIVLTLVNYDWNKITSGYNAEACWTGNHFMAYWSATFLYFLVDLIWVAWAPICVKSPTVIIKHHFIAIIYLIAPVLWPQYRWFMGALLSVEVNTWFLIARRVVYKRNYAKGIISNLVTHCFYISWIVIRCIIYPSVLFMFLQMADVGIRESQSILHWELLFVPIHFFLCILNLKWTYDLFSPIITRWIKREESGGETKLSSGL